MQATKRLVIFGSIAGAAATLAWLAPEPAVNERPASSAAQAARPPDGNEPRFTLLSGLPPRAPIGEADGDTFSPRAWAPAAEVRSLAAAPAPVAPPNPYRVAGVLLEDSATQVFLSKAERVYEAAAGDELEGGYRVEEIAADHVTLRYLPLGSLEKLAYSSSLYGGLADESETAKRADVRWEGPALVRAGAMFDVALRVSSEQPLRAAPLQVQYEPELLQPVNVRAGKFFDGGSFTYRINPDGSIHIAASGEPAAPGADAEIVVLTFRPVKVGAAAEIKVSSLALEGAGGRRLAHGSLASFRTLVQ